MKARNGSYYNRVIKRLSGSTPAIGCCLLLFSLLLAACSTTGDNTPTETPGHKSHPLRVDLPDLGPAPELENQAWLNTDQPLRLADLEGKVVLLDMWTFG